MWLKPCGEQRIWGEWQSWSICDVQTKQRSRQAACLAGAPQCNNDLIEREVNIKPISTNILMLFNRTVTCRHNRRPGVHGVPGQHVPMVVLFALRPAWLDALRHWWKQRLVDTKMSNVLKWVRIVTPHFRHVRSSSLNVQLLFLLTSAPPTRPSPSSMGPSVHSTHSALRNPRFSDQLCLLRSLRTNHVAYQPFTTCSDAWPVSLWWNAPVWTRRRLTIAGPCGNATTTGWATFWPRKVKQSKTEQMSMDKLRIPLLHSKYLPKWDCTNTLMLL